MAGKSVTFLCAQPVPDLVVLPEATPSAPTATAACAADLDTLAQIMEDYGSSDEDKHAAVGQDVDPEPVTSTTAHRVWGGVTS